MINFMTKVFNYLKYLTVELTKNVKTVLLFKWGLLNDPLRVVIGASNTNFKGWISTEQFFFDITKAESWKKNFGARKIDNLLAEHVFEHLTEDEIKTTLSLACQYLKKNGIFRIAVPDCYHPSSYMIDLVKPGGLEPAATDHKISLTIDLFKQLLGNIKFIMKSVEYFDKNGIFHSQYSDENGYIFRSKAHYSGRFTNDIKEYNKLLAGVPKEKQKYFKSLGVSTTSLIVDLIKV